MKHGKPASGFTLMDSAHQTIANTTMLPLASTKA
jgi:hypothetical protein